MHAIHELKEMLCKELEEYGNKESLTMSELDIVDKLAHAIKNIDKILEASEDGYSGYSGYSQDGHSERYSNRSYDGGSYDDGSSGDYSNARGRGSNAKRDSMGRYSSMNDSIMVKNLRQMMQQAQDPRKKREFENFIQRIENM